MMNTIYIKAALLFYLIYTSCCPPVEECPDPCIADDDISCTLEYEIKNEYDFSMNLFIFNLEGNLENAFTDGTSTLEPGEQKITREIITGESLYFRVPLYGYLVYPGMNVDLHGMIVSDAYQFYVHQDSIHFMMRISGSVGHDGDHDHEHPEGVNKSIQPLSVDNIPMNNVLFQHVQGHPCEPKPGSPPGQC